MKCCSLVTASLENGWTNFVNFFFMFVIDQVRFLGMENWKIRDSFIRNG